MAFVDHVAYSEGPKRICQLPFGAILHAFPAKVITPHERAGYQFRGAGCATVASYDADYCVPGDAKMDPQEYGGAKDAEIRVIQAAFKCSAVGATLDELREEARAAIDRNLWRSVDDTLEGILAAEATVFAGPWGPTTALANAAQFLATASQCGTGVIYGSTVWFTQLGADHLLYKDSEGFHRDHNGNIIIASSMPLDVVYAFDSEVDIKVDDIHLMDELAPGLTQVNDRVIRAETAFTVAIDPCAVASFGFDPCGPCC